MSITDFLSDFFLIFMLITLPIYILYLFTLFKYRNDEALKYSFYKLMFSLGIADVLQILNLLLGNALAGLGWVPQVYIFLGGLSARISNMGLFGVGFCQDLGVLIIAFNRLSAYVAPIKHLKIWHDQFTRRMIILQWLIPFILILPIIYPIEFQIFVAKDNKTVYLQWTSATTASYYNFGVGVILAFPVFITVITIYIIIFGASIVRKIRSKKPMGKAETAALQMAVTGFICCTGWVIVLSNNYVRLFGWTFYKVLLTDVPTYWMIDDVGNSIYAAINPYAMFIFSSAFRDRFMRLYFSRCLKKDESVGTRTAQRTITVHPTSPNINIDPTLIE